MQKILSLLLLGCGLLLAQPPSGIAIRNARIVTGSGPILQKGTVVLRNGLIDAVGENVTIPTDAWVINGEGMTVYPGLIDALSTIGITDAAATPGSARPAATPGAPAATVSRGPEDRPLTTSWLKAADLINTTDRRIESARNQGFTSAITWPRRGIFAGQGAVINLAGDKSNDMIIVPSTGQYLALVNGGFGAGYPASLMGSISYIRQIYVDADRYARIKKQYADNPRGLNRPEYDRALEGVLESQRLLLPANRRVEITRMISFSKELKRPTVLYGLQEGYLALDALQAAGLPVLINLKWPEKAREVDPENIESLKVLEVRDKAATTPAELAKKGVKFAFYADGIDQPADILKAVRKAMQAGLSEADALKAMTITPAEIFGFADRLGSIEKGKIGNLVVTKGGIFDEKPAIQHVFIDGVKYDPAPDTQTPAAAGARATGGGKEQEQQ
ncbi:amidohydrolase [Bryobacterales bacterium F-183]|nr:amidohydrolase [Bryobacterales bacterium F-183]